MEREQEENEESDLNEQEYKEYESFKQSYEKKRKVSSSEEGSDSEEEERQIVQQKTKSIKKPNIDLQKIFKLKSEADVEKKECVRKINTYDANIIGGLVKKYGEDFGVS